jgi:hypothetical protein
MAAGSAGEFCLAVSANAVKCGIIIPAIAQQTEQRGFFIFQLPWARAFNHSIPAQANTNLLRLFRPREPRSRISLVAGTANPRATTNTRMLAERLMAAALKAGRSCGYVQFEHTKMSRDILQDRPGRLANALEDGGATPNSRLGQETLRISFPWQEIFSFRRNNAGVLPLSGTGIRPN